jgi:hypothetical protein
MFWSNSFDPSFILIILTWTPYKMEFFSPVPVLRVVAENLHYLTVVVGALRLQNTPDGNAVGPRSSLGIYVCV